MIDAIRKIEIKDFIKILILDLNKEEYVYFVDYYNEKYFYVKDNNQLCTHQSIYTYYNLYFSKADTIYRENLDKLKKEVYKLYKQLTFKIPRAEKDTKYYIISRNFNVVSATEFNDIKDDNQYRAYNYFKSKAEATKCAEKLKAYLIELRKEECCNE